MYTVTEYAFAVCIPPDSGIALNPEHSTYKMSRFSEIVNYKAWGQ